MRAVITAIRRAIARYREQPPLRRELLLFAAMLLFAILVLPTLIWIAGQIFLGDYIRTPSGTPTGGPLALTFDFLSGAFTLSPGHLFVLFGPYVLVQAGRWARLLLKM
jgi:hypothetical protein